MTVNLKKVHFTDSLTGYICADNSVLKTTDAGENWTRLGAGNNFYGIYFLNKNTGWIGGRQKEIRKTTDGGVSWERQTK